MFEPNLTINSFFPTNLCKKGLHPRGRAGWHCLSFPFYRGERRGGATRWERGRGGAQPSWVGRRSACGGQRPLHLCTGGGRSPRSVGPGAAEKVTGRTPRGSGGARRAQRRRRDPGPRAARSALTDLPLLFLCRFRKTFLPPLKSYSFL